MNIFINHLGYDKHGRKKCVLNAPEQAGLTTFILQDERGSMVYEGLLHAHGAVDRWKNWYFWQGDFSEFATPGRYRIRVNTNAGDLVSESFAIQEHLLPERCVSDLLFYFTSQRCSGKFDRANAAIPFVGERQDRVNVRGGWYDASGDVSKYLSHLSYANYMNPQQIPLVAWNLLHAADLAAHSQSVRLQSLVEQMREEALHGANFLMRMQDPAGYFYMTVFDRWSKDIHQREICAYETQKGHKTDAYQAGYRQGGGMAIAALARAGVLGMIGDYDPADYLAAAEKGFAHLEVHNQDYLDDGRENIIDDYCALLAGTELYHATRNAAYLNNARSRHASLVNRLSKDQRYTGWWRANALGNRPFFHASDAGLPVVALVRYLEVDTDPQQKNVTLEAIHASLEFELTMTNEVANPFGYARQYVKPVHGEAYGAFFVPHANESGYWWQGENARLASLAAAALLASAHLRDVFQLNGKFRQKLRNYAVDQLDWILGLNPFDVCMLQGRGRNNPDYLAQYPNAPGGVCNGITSGFDDEHDIDFLPEKYADNMEQNWRWAEQWIPHGAWLLLALTAL